MSQTNSLKIAVLCDRKMIEGHPFHAVGEKYLSAIIDYLGAQVIMLPGLPQSLALLEQADGLMLTGSHSNIEPHHYSEQDHFPDDLRDLARDKFSPLLIEKSLELDIPILGICRGLQELNVTMGGSMHQRLTKVDGFFDHTEDKHASLDDQYAQSHDVALSKDGILASAYSSNKISVNSLHMQGVQRLADTFVAEAVAADGLIEAFRLQSDDRFLLAVQWHPEWKVLENPDYQVIFDVFAKACIERKK